MYYTISEYVGPVHVCKHVDFLYIVELEEDLISSCAGWKVKSERRMLLKLRGGTAAFQVELGRWYGVRREDRMCKECNSGEVEDVVHWLLRCVVWRRLRESLRSHCTIKSGQNEEEEVANILCEACVSHIHITSP